MAKTVIAGVKQVIRTGVKATTTVVKQGWKLAARAIGTSVAQGVAKECITQLANYGVDQALMPSIENEIKSRVEAPIQNWLSENQKVKEMLTLDAKNGNARYQAIIKNAALELLRQDVEFKSQLQKIAEGIALGVAKNKIKGLSTILQVSEAIEAINKIETLVPEFIKNLSQKINEIYQQHNLGQQATKDNNQQENTPTQTQDSQTNSDSKDELNQATPPQPIQLTSATTESDQDHNAADNKVTDYQEEPTQIKTEVASKSPEVFTGSFVVAVTASITNLVKGKILRPATHAFGSFAAGQITKGIDRDLKDRLQDYQAERRTEFFQNGDQDKRIPQDFKQGLTDKEAIEKAKTIQTELANGGEAGLVHLGALSDATGRPIHVLDEKGNLCRIIGDDKNQEPLQARYYPPNDKNLRGHWTLPNGRDAPSSGGNNCLFDVIRAQTEEDAQKLRNNTVACLNMETLANSACDIKRLEMRKKHALQMGGVKFTCNYSTGTREGPRTGANNMIDAHEGTRTTPLGDPAHARSSHVGDVKGKTTFVDTQQQDKAFELARSANNQYILLKPHAREEKVLQRIIVAKIDQFAGKTQFGKDVKNLQYVCLVEHARMENKKPTEWKLQTFYPKEVLDPEVKRLLDSGNCGKRFKVDENLGLGLSPKTTHTIEHIPTEYKSDNRYNKNNKKPNVQKGLTCARLTCAARFSTAVYEYSMFRITEILILRLLRQQLTKDMNIAVLANYYSFNIEDNNISDLIFNLKQISKKYVLVPLSLYNKHAVGIIFVKQQNNTITAIYIDPENNIIPKELKRILTAFGIRVKQLPTETQKYTNCGPEVIENFIYYLTGKRATQEAAVCVHSLLLENILLNPVEYAARISENNKLIRLLSNQELTVDKPLIYTYQLSINSLITKQLPSTSLATNQALKTSMYTAKSTEQYSLKNQHYNNLSNYSLKFASSSLELKQNPTVANIVPTAQKTSNLISNTVIDIIKTSNTITSNATTANTTKATNNATTSNASYITNYQRSKEYKVTKHVGNEQAKIIDNAIIEYTNPQTGANELLSTMQATAQAHTQEITGDIYLSEFI